MKSLIQKKGQQEIIVTVLLVLVALVAVGAVVVFVNQMIQKNVASAKNKANCMDLAFTIEKATNESITITRGSDNLNISQLKVYINGESSTTITPPNAIETKKANITAKVGDKIRINPVMGDYICENGAEATVA